MRHILHGTFSGQVVFVDEISFVSIDLLAALEHLRLKGVRIICFGDFKQLPPVKNRWRACSISPDVFQHARLLKQWSDCTRFVLTRCRRSHQGHFDFYTRVPDMNLSDALAEAMEPHPQDGASHVEYLHIALASQALE